MEDILLNLEQAQRICNDFQYLVGNQYNIAKTRLTVSLIEVKELDTKNGFTVVVFFDIIYGSFEPFYIIDRFCQDFDIEFNLGQYLN